mmetsp:Transcript_58805/g.144136  ORF Transcript_58805/g.144136 Transcript_58805/m.144136 type:complete len:663 (+) Transcript_58805:609-2597(+)
MIEFHMNLGIFLGNKNSLFLPGINNPNILIIPNENTIILWSLKTGSMIAFLKKSSNVLSKIVNIEAAKYKNSTNIWLAAGFDCGIIQIWKLNINKSNIECRIFAGHDKSLCQILFDKTNFLLASASKDGSLVLWDILKKIGIFRIKYAHTGKISCLCFINSSNIFTKYIVTCGIDILIKFWDINSGSCCKILSIPFRAIFCIKFFSKKKLLIFSTESQKIPVYQKKKFLKFFFIGQIWKSKTCSKSKFKIDKKNNFLVVYGKNKFLEIFAFKKKATTVNVLEKFKNRKIKISNVFSNSFSYSFNSKIIGIDFWENNKNRKIILYIHFSSFHFELFKIRAVVDLKKDTTVSLFKVYHGKIESHQSDVREISWFSNDSLIVSLCGFAKTINVWYLNTQKCRITILLNSTGLCMALCSSKSIVVGNKKGNIEIVDLFSGNLIFSKNKAHSGPVWAVEVLKNLFCLITGGSDGFLKIWEFDSSDIFLSKYLKLMDQILEIKLLPRKNLLITSTLSSKLDIFLLDNLQFNYSLYGHNLPILSLSVCDDDLFLASGSADFSFRIWDLKTRQIIKIISNLDSVVTSVSFQKHNRNIFTGFRNGKICMWSQNDYFLLCCLENFHRGPIWVLKSSNHGNFLASGSQDKNLKIWKIQKNNDKAKISSFFLLR